MTDTLYVDGPLRGPKSSKLWILLVLAGFRVREAATVASRCGWHSGAPSTARPTALSASRGSAPPA